MNTKQTLVILAISVVMLATGCASSPKAPDTKEQYVCRVNCKEQKQQPVQKYFSIEEQMAAEQGVLDRQAEATKLLKLHRYCKAYANGQHSIYVACVERRVGKGYFQAQGFPWQENRPRNRCPELFDSKGPCW